MAIQYLRVLFPFITSQHIMSTNASLSGVEDNLTGGSHKEGFKQKKTQQRPVLQGSQNVEVRRLGG